MQAVASYISRRFFVGNCRKFVVSLSDCQRKTFIFKALRRFLSTCRPYYRWRSCLHNWPVCKTVLIWALSGLCPDSALWLWAIIERIRVVFVCSSSHTPPSWQSLGLSKTPICSWDYTINGAIRLVWNLYIVTQPCKTRVLLTPYRVINRVDSKSPGQGDTGISASAHACGCVVPRFET